MDSVVCFVDIYSVDSDFSVGGVMQPLNNWASVLHCFVMAVMPESISKLDFYPRTEICCPTLMK